MKKVVVQYDDTVKFFENVTKVQCFCNEHLDIFQGKKKTVLKMGEIKGFEVKND